MKTIDDQHVVDCLDYRTLIEALRAGFACRNSQPIQMRQETGTDADSKVLLVKAAWDREVTVVKAVTLNANNRQSEVPYIQGLVAIFDKASGTPLGVVDAKEMTNRRTAAASALAADYLARPNAEVMTLIGTGLLAPHMALAHAATRPIRRVNVFGRSLDKAEATAGTISRSAPAVQVRAVRDLPEAVREADIVSTATSSKSPVLHGAWISAGTHVDLVGAFTPDAREADDETMAGARVFLDDRNTTVEEAGDIALPMASGTIAANDIVGDLWDLCGGQVAGRTADREVTVFKSVGTALEDLVAAKLVVGLC